MTVDYDAPRRTAVDTDEPPDHLGRRREAPEAGVLDADDADVESYLLPGAELFDEELVVRVIPRQADEFTCASCFLVHHRSRLARGRNGQSICTDCA